MSRINTREVLYLTTSYLLEKRGYPRPNGYNIEWDAKEPDSQYSMCYEDVEFVFEALDKYGYEIRKKGDVSPATVTYNVSSPATLAPQQP